MINVRTIKRPRLGPKIRRRVTITMLYICPFVFQRRRVGVDVFEMLRIPLLLVLLELLVLVRHDTVVGFEEQIAVSRRTLSVFGCVLQFIYKYCYACEGSLLSTQ